MKGEALKALIDWSLDHGATLPKAVRFDYCDIKGVLCICEENVDEAALKIPQELIISPKLVELEFPEAQVDVNPNTWLKFLLSKLKFDHEKCISGLGTKFKPYIDCLPVAFDSPLVWNPLELSLLAGTNLGNSIKAKLRDILREWYEFIQVNRIFEEEKCFEEISIYKNFENVDDEWIFRRVIEPVAMGLPVEWYSMSAFLWSHLVLISRAFPEYIVDEDVDPTRVMLLPLIDLLNHNCHSKVAWTYSNGQFECKNLESLKAGEELTNNYGCKGNEELLSGYGFVLEDNAFDFVALKIKLPQETISNIIKYEPDLKLPTIDDFTTFAFEHKSKDKEEKLTTSFNDGVTYFINRRNETCLESLLKIFAYLCKSCRDKDWRTLTSRFKGLQNLRNALVYKLDAVHVRHPKNCEYSDFLTRPYRKHCAEIYRAGQISVLKYAVAKVKEIEKTWLADNKTRLLTIKKILKQDPLFSNDELPDFFEGRDPDDIIFESNFELFVVWILIKNQNNSFHPKHEWVSKQYESFLNCLSHREREQSCHAKASMESLFQRLNARDATENKLSIEEVRNAFIFVELETFTRVASSNPDTILVKRV